jgi:RNA polymerase sigma-70 factor (ECF subfamily)
MVEWTAEDERRLIDRLQRRERTAMTVLYDRFGKTVYSLLLRMVRNDALAQDLTQECFLRVWTNIGGYEPEKGSLAPWILTVARNRALDHLRSSGHRMSMAAQDSELLERMVRNEAERDPALEAGRADAVRQAFGKLPASQQQVLGLAYFEGLSQTEIAEKLEKPLGTVKTRSALTFMRRELEPWAER